MCRKMTFLVSTFVLAFACTCSANVVIGDFEGDLGAWVPYPGSGAVLELGTVGATSGNASLDLTVTNSGAYWQLQWVLPEGLVLDLSNVTTLELDATMLVDNFADGTWTKVDKLAINSDLGWREVEVTTVFDNDTGQEVANKEWGTWDGDSHRTVTWDIAGAGYDLTGLADSSYVHINIAVMGNGLFHIDNIRLNGVDIPGLPGPEQAGKPNPANGADDVPRTVTLSWKPGSVAQTHNLFFGSDFNDVNNATLQSHPNVIAAEGLDVNSFEIDNLDFGTDYYWRVDEVGVVDSGVYRGPIWRFTSEPYLYRIPAANITASANSTYPGNDPNNTINESGLDPGNPDIHSQNVDDMWLSSTDANNVWIRYDFKFLYKLQEMPVWNYNNLILKDYGFREVKIEYSEDGLTWKTLPDVPEFAQAPGTDGYQYNTVVDFNGVSAKSVRLTALDNWSSSGQSLSGLSEVRFMYLPVRAREPEPQIDSINVPLDKTLKWRAGREASAHEVYISTSEQMVIDGNSPVYEVTGNSYIPSLMLGRAYYWRVDEVNNSETPSVWESEIWNFSTREYASIDDFEDYNNSQPYTIWDTWIDGITDSVNGGSRIGHNDQPFCEEEIVQGGNQSAPLYYDNTASDYSQAVRIFDVAQNFSADGADTLRLYYRGKPVTFYEGTDGTIAMSGEGTDIWGTSDQFRFAYKQLNGDATIIARVDGVQNTDSWAKAGVMIRSSLSADASNAFVLLSAAGTVAFQRRAASAGSTVQTPASGLDAPYWVRLKRTGNSFTAQRSEDGITWINVGSAVTIPMSGTVYTGFAVTSHTADVLCAATFSGIQIEGNVTGDWTVAAIGDAEQAEGENTPDALYVALEDNTGTQAKVFAPESAVGTGIWTELVIPYASFTNVDTTRVKKIIIGAGDVSEPLKGHGLVYIDSISRGHIFEK
jgi:hypothetical protein